MITDTKIYVGFLIKTVASLLIRAAVKLVRFTRAAVIDSGMIDLDMVSLLNISIEVTIIHTEIAISRGFQATKGEMYTGM